MGTSAALACFAFVLLAMNFATYFAEEEMTGTEMLLNATCENKTVHEAFDSCYKENVTPMMKDISSFCGKNVGIKGEFSMTSLFDVSCVQGGAKHFDQFFECVNDQKFARNISSEMWAKDSQFLDCLDELDSWSK